MACDAALPPHNPHHTFLLKSLMRRSTAVTSGIYTHMFDDSHKETIDRVTEAIQQFSRTGTAT